MKKRAKAGTSKEAAAARKARFVEAYLVNGRNATKAAIAAGYSKKTAGSQGARLLKDVDLRSAIEVRSQALAERFQLTTERLLEEMGYVVMQDPKDMYDEDGKLLAIHKMPEHARRAIAGFEDGKVRMWDKVSAAKAALQMLRPTPTVAVQVNQSIGELQAEPEQRTMLELARRVAYTLYIGSEQTKESV